MAKRIMFTETGEVRPPRGGEWFFENGMCHRAGYDWKREPRPILTRHEETIPDPPKPRQVVWVPDGSAPVGVGGFSGCVSFTGGIDIDRRTFDGTTYRRVEVPTKAECVHNSQSTGYSHDRPMDSGEFLRGIQWLADKLQIRIE